MTKRAAHFFTTGTDTGVGKTYFTAWLVQSWRKQGAEAVGLKPIASGDRNDALFLQAACGGILDLDEINPIHLREPAAPWVAAQAEDRELDFSALNQQIQVLGNRFSHLAVEGVGGWRVPLGLNYEVRDWARDLGMPVVVVAMNRLGVLNHTLLTVESILASGLGCAGIVLNIPEIAPDLTLLPPAGLPDFDLALSRNAALLRSILGLPVFEFDRRAEAAGQIPVWLGGKEI